jgi:lactate racemase
MSSGATASSACARPAGPDAPSPDWMRVTLQYGTAGLDVDISGSNVSVLEPKFVPGLADEAAAFRDAVATPIASPPLRDLVRSRERLAVVIPDATRALPRERLLPWLFEELADVPADGVVIVNGTGSHRGNTPEELAAMVGAQVAARYRIVNHDAHDPSTLVPVGRDAGGEAVLMNRDYVEADKRVVLGFIEPHLMAGFSGGWKGIFPAVADIASILRYHNAARIGDPRSTWGVLEGNPTQAMVRECGALCPPDFCVNVTLNRRREITRFFCGAVQAAHEAGCVFSKATAMVAVEKAFPVVVTSNSGYPLDQNLYQAVKGMSAAAQIVAADGLILTASRCNDGFPTHGNFRRLLYEHESPRALLDAILAPGFSVFDQWQAQLLALIRLKARVGVFSELPGDEVRRAHLDPVSDIADAVATELRRIGRDAPVAVLPEGPMTIPYVAA